MTEGIILLDKPPGITSFQSLGFLKRCLGTRRVGHAGTLDKFAEGLLIVMTGRMTRLCPMATAFDKEYLATFTFGVGTDTLDPEGEVTGHGAVPGLAEIEAVLPVFRGIHLPGAALPIPRSTSTAGGHRPPRGPVRRSGWRRARLSFIAWTSSIFIRPSSPSASPVPRAPMSAPSRVTLPRKLGTCAHVSRLRRTRIGGFSVDDARTPESF